MTQPSLFDLRGKRVHVTRRKGMVGSTILRLFAAENVDILVADRQLFVLTKQNAMEDWLELMRPDTIFSAAGMVGGIYANDTYSADFISIKLAIVHKVIRSAHNVGVKKVLTAGSSDIYPKRAP